MMEQLPIQLDCFLMTWGFFENDKMPGAQLHAPVHVKEDKPAPWIATGWMPSYKGEECPF